MNKELLHHAGETRGVRRIRMRTEGQLTSLFALLVAVQLLFLLWLNLTQLPYHLGYDASNDYLRAYEMYRQGTLFPDHWKDTTTSHLDAPVPLAAFFLNFTSNLFLAFGAANCVFLLAQVFFLWLILRELKAARWTAYLTLSLFLCPNYVLVNNANDLGYAACLLTSMQSYSGKFVLVFCFVWLWLRLTRRERLKRPHWWALGFCAVGYFVTGMSSGYFLGAYLLVPAVLVGVLLWLRQDKIEWVLGPTMGLSVGMLFMLMAGKVFAVRVLDFTSRDSAMELIPLEQLMDNLLAIPEGWFSLLDALPVGEDNLVLSGRGVVFLLASASAVVLLAALVMGCRQLVKALAAKPQEGTEPLEPGVALPAAVVLENLLMLGLLNTRYGNATYEDRYLIMIYVMSLLLLAVLLTRRGLGEKIMRALAVCMLGCMLVRTVWADVAYTTTKIDTALMDRVASAVGELASPVVFTCTVTDEYNLMVRNMRCYDLDRVYKPIRSGEEDAVTLNKRYQGEATYAGINWNGNFDHWGDYIYYDNADEYSGPITLLAEPEAFEELPTTLKEQFVLYVELTDDLSIYVSEENVLGL